jgi:hypothetical protein
MDICYTIPEWFLVVMAVALLISIVVMVVMVIRGEG